MLTEHLTREQRIADLEIHGWEPVRDAPNDARVFRGIWNATLQLGFAWSRSLAGNRVIQLEGYWNPPTPCPWSYIGDEILGRITERLAEV